MKPLKNKKIFFFLLLLIGVLGISPFTYGQTKNKGTFIGNGQPTLKAYEKAAKKAFKKKNYYAAYKFFYDAVQLDTQKIENQFQLGESARLYGDFSKARDAYAKVVELDKDKYPRAIYRLGQMEKQLGNYEVADTILVSFQNLPVFPNSPYFQDLASKDIGDIDFVDSLEFVKLYSNEQLAVNEYEVLCLPDSTINTEYSEVNPVWRDGQLYYGALRFEKKDDTQLPTRKIAHTLRSNLLSVGEEWAEINNKNTTTTHLSFAPEDDRLYYTICDYGEEGDIRCAIYYKNKLGLGEVWGAAKKLPLAINDPNYTSTHPSIGVNEAGEEVLYFVSDRPEGKGGLDIWYTRIVGEDGFSEPVNLDLNTAEDDVTPFYHFNSQSLYFSSKGRKGLGAFDIYKSSITEKGNWSKIANLPAPANSSSNDFHYFLEGDGRRGFMVSNRENCVVLEDLELGCNDIFLVNVGVACSSELAFTVVDKENQKNIENLTIQVFLGEEVITLNQENKDSEGRYIYTDNLEEGTYKIRISAPDYKTDSIVYAKSNCVSMDFPFQLEKEPCKPKLTVQVFKRETTDPILNGTMTLFPQIAARGISKTEPTNEFVFDNIAYGAHWIITSHNEYALDTITVNMSECEQNAIVYLKDDLEDFLPITCYFENAIPRYILPRSKRTDILCDFSYELYYEDFAVEENISYYEQEFLKGKTGMQRQKDSLAIHKFFREEVIANHRKLQTFKNILLKRLKTESFVLSIQGYASNLGSPVYNKKLAHRRVESIKNYFIQTYGEAFAPYLDSGKLKLRKVPVGEVGEDKFKSSDRQNAVFNPVSARQRKAEIIRVQKTTSVLGMRN